MHKLALPAGLFPSQHENLPRSSIRARRLEYVSFGRDPEELIDVRPTPSILVVYVFAQLLACPGERKQRAGVEERRDMGERLSRELEQFESAGRMRGVRVAAFGISMLAVVFVRLG